MIKYIYIDDENDQTTTAIKDGLNDVGIIHVDLERPQSFEIQSEDLINKLDTYDGIILDLRLDDNPQSEAKYTAPPLAQALRTNASINIGKKDCPIVLCSTDAKIKKSYLADQSSHDLFDYKFLKDDAPNWNKIVHKLDSLAKGYKTINEKIGDVSYLLNRNFKDLDGRIFDRFIDPEIKYPAHDYGRFIVKEFLGQPGPLINEKFLASRLGIDSTESKGWNDLREKCFGDAKYIGVFSDGWNRWWTDLVAAIFKRLTNKRLAALNAEERVKLLIEATGVELVAAKPIPRSISTNYWTVCEYYKKPLDPLEGFRIHTQKEPKPWQDPRYLSIDAAVERKGINKGLKTHLSEQERLEKIKAQLKEKEK